MYNQNQLRLNKVYLGKPNQTKPAHTSLILHTNSFDLTVVDGWV